MLLKLATQSKTYKYIWIMSSLYIYACSLCGLNLHACYSTLTPPWLGAELVSKLDWSSLGYGCIVIISSGFRVNLTIYCS